MSMEEHDSRNWFRLEVETDRINYGEGDPGTVTVKHSVRLQIGERDFYLTASKSTDSKRKHCVKPWRYGSNLGMVIYGWSIDGGTQA